MLLYYVSRRSRLSLRSTVIVGALVSIPIFIGMSSLLYLDIIPWPLPFREGSVWMFHTLITRINKADVPVYLVVAMFTLYPVWHALGYIFALRRDVGAFILQTISYEDVKSKKERNDTEIAVRRGPIPSQITREAIEALGGMGRFVKEGDRVLIKPNICGGNPKIEGSFTCHEVVEELVKMVRELDADPFVADADMIWTRFEPVAEEQGWMEWADRMNVPLVTTSTSARKAPRGSFPSPRNWSMLTSSSRSPP
jgi:hypothetical protein